MSNSLDYCAEHIKRVNGYKPNFKLAEEYPSKEYFDRVMNGKRVELHNIDGGKIKKQIYFDQNADFNYAAAWSGMRHYFENDLTDQIDNAVYELCSSKVTVPFKDGEPVGGWPKAGDKVAITIGNIIAINEIKIINGTMNQEIHVMIPYKYERIPDGFNEK